MNLCRKHFHGKFCIAKLQPFDSTWLVSCGRLSYIHWWRDAEMSWLCLGFIHQRKVEQLFITCSNPFKDIQRVADCNLLVLVFLSRKTTNQKRSKGYTSSEDPQRRQPPGFQPWWDSRHSHHYLHVLGDLEKGVKPKKPRPWLYISDCSARKTVELLRAEWWMGKAWRAVQSRPGLAPVEPAEARLVTLATRSTLHRCFHLGFIFCHIRNVKFCLVFNLSYGKRKDHVGYEKRPWNI